VAEVSFTVYGTPAPQGSKRAFVGKSGKAHVIESSHDRVKSWRQAVIDQVRSDGWIVPPFPYSGPLEVTMVFYFKRPQGHWRTGRNAHLLRDSAPAYPFGKPDLSKLARSTEDAISDAGIWADDAQVVRYPLLAKYWATPVTLPGAVITIREIGETR
jgi:Holliday junction resolvase RusA-like endonuclease